MKTVQVFLGANTAGGFVSHFYDSSIPKAGYRTYLIKGGPGTGKSTFMKLVAAEAEARGEQVVLAPCSSDPDSLDGVILPGRKVMVLDATAPHTVEPLYPGAAETLLDFGAFWKEDVLQTNRASVMAVQDEYTAIMKKVSRLLRAMGQAVGDRHRLSLCAVDLSALTDKAEKLAAREWPNGTGGGTEQVCFLSTQTAKGVLQLTDTVQALADRIILLHDSYGAAADVLLSLLRDRALSTGQRLICAHDPLLPDTSIAQLILPDCRVAFVRESDRVHWPDTGRRVRLDRYYDKATLSRHAKRLRFDSRLYEELQALCERHIGQGRECHDRLEDCYKAAMDYEALNRACARWLAQIFEKPFPKATDAGI